MRYGDVTEDQAFAMVTINPAKQLRIDNRVGSIEVGKDADLVDLEPPSALAPPRSSSAPTSTASPTTTARRICSASPTSRRRRRAPGADAADASPPPAAPTATARRPVGQAAASRRRRREVRRQGQRRRPDLGDHQRAHRDRLRSGDPEGHDRHQGQSHRGGRRERRACRPARSRSTPAARPLSPA